MTDIVRELWQRNMSEILLSILGRLPLQDLRNATRVSRLWEMVVLNDIVPRLAENDRCRWKWMHGRISVGWLEGSENFVDAFYATRCFSDGVELIAIEEGQSTAIVYDGTDIKGVVKLPEEARSGCQVHFGHTIYLMRCGRSGIGGDEVMVAVDRNTIDIVAVLNTADGNEVVESVFEVATHRKKKKQLLVVTQRRVDAQMHQHQHQQQQPLQEVHVVREDKQRVRLESTGTVVYGRVVAANEECVVVLKESPININYNMGYYVNVELAMVDYLVGRVRWSRHSRTESREPFAPYYALAAMGDNSNRSTKVHLTDKFVLVSKSINHLWGSVWDALHVDTGNVASEAEMRVADLPSVTLGNRLCFSACKMTCARGEWMVTATDLSPSMGHGVGNRQDVQITNVLDCRKISMEQPYHRRDLATHSFEANSVPLDCHFLCGSRYGNVLAVDCTAVNALNLYDVTDDMKSFSCRSLRYGYSSAKMVGDAVGATAWKYKRKLLLNSSQHSSAGTISRIYFKARDKLGVIQADHY